VLRNPGEYGIARQKDCVTIDGALRDVCIGDRYGDTFSGKHSAQVTDTNPMIQRRFVNRSVLQQLADDSSLLCGRSADELRDDNRRHDGGATQERFFELLRFDSGEEVDPDGRINDDAGHGFPRDRLSAGPCHEARERARRNDAA
jgi:hypothetical protein